MAKPRLIREETYKRPGLRIKDEARPVLKHTNGFVVDEAFITRAGIQEIDGRRREYQDLRVYLSES